MVKCRSSFVPQAGDQVFNLGGKPLTVGVKGKWDLIQHLVH